MSVKSKLNNTDQEARLLQLKLLALYGGSPGIRDIGLLQSAISRADNLIAYGNPTVFDLATSYAYGIAKNHPFNDCNKRTAFAITFCFLFMNNINLKVSNKEAADKMVELASSSITEFQFSNWLKENSILISNLDTSWEAAFEVLIEQYSGALSDLFNR